MRPQANPAVARFLLGFAWSARQAPFSRGVRALAQLGADAVSLYRELDAGGVEMHLNDRPYLYVYGSRDAAAAARQSLQRALGEPSDLFGPVLDADELRRREPCLAGDVAGYEVNGQMTVNPSVLVDSLAAHLRAAGVEIREGARATAIASRPDGATVHTSAGAVRGRRRGPGVRDLVSAAGGDRRRAAADLSREGLQLQRADRATGPSICSRSRPPTCTWHRWARRRGSPG